MKAGVNPYYRYLYRVDFSGENLKPLTPAAGTHSIEFSPDGKYFTDSWSQPDVPPVHEVRDIEGKLIATLEKTDISRLKATGWKPPQPFVVKSADGRWDLYGLLYLPTSPATIDPAKKYPVIVGIYPGPQGGSVGSWGFSAARGHNQALAELGFVVVQIEGSCNPGRSKSFHDACYGNMGENTLPDQVAGLEQLAKRMPFLDLESRLSLDRRRWRLTLDCRGTEFMPVTASPEEHRKELKRKVETVFSHGDLDPSKWVVLLSGGVDSRAIISLLKNGRDFRCVTWGLNKALGIERSDASIARQLAERLGLNHTYFELDMSPKPAEALLNRFLVAGEGRVDAITGYMDGFELWRQLFEAGVAGVIRGDHGFGPRHPVYTSFGARQKCACLLLSDYENVPRTLATELPLQHLPERLFRLEIRKNTRIF